MGGLGSGRPGWKQKVEHTRALDVNRLHKAGRLTPGSQGNWQWTRDGRRVAYIHLEAASGGLLLTYRVRIDGGEWTDVAYTVPLTWVACTKGGARPYFLCPGRRNGQPCGRRVAKLCSGGTYFLCRHCYQLAYASQSEARHDRLLRRRNKLGWALHPDAELFEFMPPRPKGMWRKTYEARLAEIARLDEEAEADFKAWLTRRYPGMPLDSILRG